MKQSTIQFQIDQLRKDKMIVVMEAIAIQVFALFVSAYAPQLLLRYYYQNQQLFEEPALLTYIPVASFAVGALFFIYAVVSNILRWRKIKQLEEEMLFIGSDDACGCGGDCQCGSETNWDELDELDKIVEEAIAESKAEAKKAVSKSKKATSKPAAKSTATKKKAASPKKATKSTSKKK
jgi:hypothetical protein